MTYFFITIVILLLFTTLHARKDLFEPYKIYIFLYASLLAVYTLHLSRYQKPWSSTSVIVFGGASFTFIGGCLLVKFLHMIRNPYQISDQFETNRNHFKNDAESINWNWFTGVFLVCSVIFLFAFLHTVLSVGYIPAFAQNPDSVRLKFLQSSIIIGYGWYFGPISLMLAGEIILFGLCSRKQKIFVLIVAILVFVFYFSLNMRLDIFRFCLFIAILVHYGKRQFNFKLLLYAASIFVLLFAIALIIRIDSEALVSLSNTLKLKLPKKYIWIANVYAYIANNFWNFDYAMRSFVDGNMHYPTSYGFETFRPFVFLLRLESLIQNTYGFDSPYNESVAMLRGLNSIVYVWHFYKDFGIFGALFIPLLAGMFVSRMYYNLITFPNLHILAQWAIIVGIIIFSYMVPLWSLWPTYFNMLVIWIAHRKITTQSNALAYCNTV